MANTIEQNLQTIIDIKQNIKTAIENKGITVGDVSFTEYANKIGEISSGGITTIDVAADGISFYGNSTMTEIPAYYNFDGKFKRIRYLFYNCESLISVPAINCGNVEGLSTNAYTFDGCYNLVNCGGLTDLGKKFSGQTTNIIDFYDCSLSKESLLNIFNSVYDLSERVYSYSGTAKIKLSTAEYNLLSPSEIAIATNKYWTVTTS